LSFYKETLFTPDFNGRRVDTIAEGMMVEPETWVKVIAVRGHRVIVRQLEEEPQA